MTRSGARPADRVDFLPTGEHFEFLSDPADESRLVFDFVVDPGGGVPLRHLHRRQEEVYRCRAGQLDITVGDELHVLSPGQDLTVPAGAVHSLANHGPEPVRCEVEYRPAGRNRQWFQIQGAYMEAQGREPRLLDLAPFIGDVEVYVERPSVPVQRALFAAVLKPLAILTGRRRRMLRLARARFGDGFEWPTH